MGGLERYEPLRDHLAVSSLADQLLLEFAEGEELVGPLPHDARHLRQWWVNGATDQARAWQAAGWRVRLVDTGTEQVLFERFSIPVGHPPFTGTASSAAESKDRSYLAAIHLPLLAVLAVLCIVAGSACAPARTNRRWSQILSSPCTSSTPIHPAR